MSDYATFLAAKTVAAEEVGFDIDLAEINPILKPHQQDIVRWAVRRGRAALFESFGLGKTMQQLEIARLILKRTGGRWLIVHPLGVLQEFQRDAATLGISVRFVRTIEECAETGIHLTNYESVREGKLDPRQFTGVSLDEAGILRGFGGTKTFRTFMATMAGDDRRDRANVIKDEGIPFRFVATATPSPNEFIELLAYSAFLGVMDVSAAKTRFFKRNSEKADALTLHPHKEAEFWQWMTSWAVFVQRPSDLGYSDEGYELPPLDIRWHEIPSDHSQASVDRSGRARMFVDSALGLSEAAAEKRRSMTQRVAKLVELVHERRGTAGVSEGLLRGESGAVVGGPTGAWTEELPGESGRVQSAVEAVAGTESRTEHGTTGGVPREESRNNYHAQQGVVSGEQGPSERSGSRSEAVEIRPDRSSVHRDGSQPVGSVPDLRYGDGEAGGRSRPRDGNGEGNSLPTVQRGSGYLSGQPGNPLEGGGISDQIVIWCDLNDEQHAIEEALAFAGISYTSLYGNQDIEQRAAMLAQWRARETCVLLTKPSMYGAGVNLQQAAFMVFAGVGYKFSDVIQATHRIHRFLQTRPCQVHFIYTEAEREVRATLERKWRQHEELVENMTTLIREHGLAEVAKAPPVRAMGVERRQEWGTNWTLINNDSVIETAAMESDSVDLILTSIPFSTQYEYSPNYADFGHTDDEAHFWRQMDYLTPNLLRVLRPGRNLVIHCKDRIAPGGLTGFGFQTVQPFHANAIFHYTLHGFAYLGMKTVVTDVVRENNQTYRLGWTEQCKDGTRMGVGMPEYLLIFRKPPTDNSDGYADVPVVKDKATYSRARWQTDAHGFARSSGNRLLTVEDVRDLEHDRIYQRYREESLNTVYDYEAHVALGESMEEAGRLPVTFQLLPPHSWHPDVWTDVARMRTLNSQQYSKGKEMHLCLARGSLVLTYDGYKPIQDVAVGDLVLTHKGRWRPVLAVENTGVRPVVTLRAQGVPGLTLTPDHKVWARFVRDMPWARSHARLEARRVTPDWLEASRTKGSYVNQKLPPVEQSMSGSEGYWWTVGRWLADGHIDANGAAIVSCASDEIEELQERLGPFGGANPYHTGTALQVRLRDPGGHLRKTLLRCGSGAHGKHLPPEAYTLPGAMAAALLRGYLSGDGHYLPERQRWMASSVSKELLLGMATLAHRGYGAIASIYPGRGPRAHQIDGRTVQAKQDWIFSFDIPNAQRKNGLPFVENDGAWMRVRSVETAGEVETWNLRVEEDESYTAEGMVVKNCPLQFDIVDRVITQMSMEGETVFDPFSGIGTVPLRAVKLGRRGLGCELSPGYHDDAVYWLKKEDAGGRAATIFDFIGEAAS